MSQLRQRIYRLLIVDADCANKHSPANEKVMNCTTSSTSNSSFRGDWGMRPPKLREFDVAGVDHLNACAESVEPSVRGAFSPDSRVSYEDPNQSASRNAKANI